MSIEVKAVCPKCGSVRYVSCGQVENVIYRKCLEDGCGHRGTMIRLRSDEVEKVVIRRGAQEQSIQNL